MKCHETLPWTHGDRTCIKPASMKLNRHHCLDPPRRAYISECFMSHTAFNPILGHYSSIYYIIKLWLSLVKGDRQLTYGRTWAFWPKLTLVPSPLMPQWFFLSFQRDCTAIHNCLIIMLIPVRGGK